MFISFIAPYHMVHRHSIRWHSKQFLLVHRKHSFRTRLVVSIRYRLFHVGPWAIGNCYNHHFVWSLHPTVWPINSNCYCHHDMSCPNFFYAMYMANWPPATKKIKNRNGIWNFFRMDFHSIKMSARETRTLCRSSVGARWSFVVAIASIVGTALPAPFASAWW